MKKHLYIALVIVAAFAAAIGTFAAVAPDDRPGTSSVRADPAGDAKVLRDSSHRLTSPQRSELTLVEFLDFECESCGAVYPAVERLKEEYGDRVTFVARYFPMPGHRNGELAARVVEAAARQGRFEEMHDELFRTQAAWGEAQESKEDVFRGYARDIGLDMTRFDADLDAPATAERVRLDRRDGLALGVQGTPTFFVDGEQIPLPQSYEAFRALIEQELER
ncbi:DsbA family protein [Streptomyces zhihengii]|uniref:DsbA family protein n=1 Tax=Streptomyces zhihengii TaxID=1818004 RepID=UPI0036313B11